MSKFQVRTVPYEQNGLKLILRTDYYNGYKAYWIENGNGEKVYKPRFYNHDTIEDILKDAGVE